MIRLFVRSVAPTVFAVALGCAACSGGGTHRGTTNARQGSSTTASGIKLPPGRFSVRLVVDSRARPCRPGWVSSALLERDCVQLGRVLLSAADVASAKAVADPTTSTWVVSVAFNTNGTARWEQVLTSVAHQRIAILVNGAVVASPTINGGTEPTLPIAGGYSEANAKHIAAELSA
jgi:hypothetical protein